MLGNSLDSDVCEGQGLRDASPSPRTHVLLNFTFLQTKSLAFFSLLGPVHHLSSPIYKGGKRESPRNLFQYRALRYNFLWVLESLRNK